MNNKIKIVFTLATSLYFFTACNESTTTTENDKMDTATSQTDKKDSMNMNMGEGLMGSMNTMMDKMSGMKMSGDFDIDFANMMIEHHQGAIDMSEMEIKSGTDDKLKGMAQKIITAQKEEIGKLQEVVKENKAAGMKMGEGELGKSTSDMKAKMSNMQMTGNTDKDFAMMMVSHHEGAIAMSKMELKHGMNAQLKKMAQKAIDDQTREITEFKSWMDANK
jgi:uncharacterized protein (DUF305 family)